YRFIAVRDSLDSGVEFRLTDRSDPLLLATTGSGDKESGAAVDDLKAGVPYHFTFDVRNLSGDVRLLVQGSNLPKDALGQLTLYPQQSVARIERAQLLLAKALQLIAGLGLNE